MAEGVRYLAEPEKSEARNYHAGLRVVATSEVPQEKLCKVVYLPQEVAEPAKEPLSEEEFIEHIKQMR